MDAQKPSALNWFSTRIQNGRDEVYDPVRKKFMVLSPEEEIRQKMMHYLVHQAQVPMGLMAVEYHIQINTRSKRCDIVVFSRKGTPLLIVECKAPQVKLDHNTIEQIAMYNINLKVNFLIITNGSATFCLQFDAAAGMHKIINSIPSYTDMCAASGHEGK